MTENFPSTPILLIRLLRCIGFKRRLQLFALFVLMIFASFSEMLSLAAVVPFLSILTSSDQASSHWVVIHIVDFFGISDHNALLLPLTILFVITAFASSGMRFLLLLVQTRLSHAIGSDFSLEMYRRTLHQPFLVHVKRNSSEVISGISSKAKAIVSNILLPILTIISSSMLLCTILIVLLNIEPFVTLVALMGFTFIYLVIIYITKKTLLENSKQISEGQTNVIRILQEGLGGIREVLLEGTQDAHCDLYRSVDLPIRRAVANVQIISVSPRYGVEALGMMLIAVLAYVLTLRDSGIANAIPILGVFALGAQRMLPMLQQSYAGWTSIRSGLASLRDSLELLEQPLPEIGSDANKLNFNRDIVLRNISFGYSNTSPKILSGLTFTITKGMCVGFIGSTGSGKSTLLDVFMGLLVPTSGEILVDGVKISDMNRQAWQRNIAHVPQSIFLSDSTINDNIVLNGTQKEINLDRLTLASNKAQLSEFVDSLDDKFNTMVGEHGVRLSGGQRQRIGIARALYKRAELLILDEATSALDNETESKVMNAIDVMGDNVTIIIVAHRLSTLKNCDLIIELEAGQIKRAGSYEKIIGS